MVPISTADTEIPLASPARNIGVALIPNVTSTLANHDFLSLWPSSAYSLSHLPCFLSGPHSSACVIAMVFGSRLNIVLQKCMSTLNLRICLYREMCLCKYTWIEMRWYYWIRVGCPIRDRKRHTEIQTGIVYVKMEAEMEVMLPQVKKYRRPPEAGRSKKGPWPRAFRGSVALLTPWLIFLSHKVYGNLLGQF